LQRLSEFLACSWLGTHLYQGRFSPQSPFQPSSLPWRNCR
jgi:hypothetical protein